MMTAPVTQSTRDLRSLPKAHLHLHLEGAMRFETLQELAERYDLPASMGGDGSFASFIALYRAACEALRSPDYPDRLVHEIVADAAIDGVVWVEISTWLSPSRPHLRVVPTLAEHPLPALLAAGVPVSVNADDPLFSTQAFWPNINSPAAISPSTTRVWPTSRAPRSNQAAPRRISNPAPWRASTTGPVHSDSVC